MQNIQQTNLSIIEEIPIHTKVISKKVTTDKKNSKRWYRYFVIDKTRGKLFTTVSCIAGITSTVCVVLDYDLRSRKIEDCSNIGLVFCMNWLSALLPSALYNCCYSAMKARDTKIKLSDSDNITVIYMQQGTENNELAVIDNKQDVKSDDLAVINNRQDIEANITFVNLDEQKPFIKEIAKSFKQKIIQHIKDIFEEIQNVDSTEILIYIMISFVIMFFTPVIVATTIVKDDENCLKSMSSVIFPPFLNLLTSAGLLIALKSCAKKYKRSLTESDS